MRHLTTAVGVRRRRFLLLPGLILVLVLFVRPGRAAPKPAALLGPVAAAGATASCDLTDLAFCDPLAKVATPEGIRSGQLDPTVWGASRDNFNNSGQGAFDGWTPSDLQPCGETAPVLPPNDLAICNGELNDVVNDGGSDASLSWYPRQPFDFAGRTGKVVFDVSDDTNGMHFAWPNFQITDSPAPDPHPNIAADRTRNLPKNSVGFDLGNLCGNSCTGPNTPSGPFDGGSCITVNQFWMTNNYVLSEFTPVMDGCVQKSPGPGVFNHFEVDISATKIVVLGTDAGTTETPRVIAELDNVTMPLTRGLIWLQDVHYNAGKPDNAPSQRDHAFTWRNVGFDGPVLPGDEGVEYPDSMANPQQFNGIPGRSLGYDLPSGQSKTFTFPGLTNAARASGGLFVATVGANYQTPTVTLTVNGRASIAYPWPMPAVIGGDATNGDIQQLAVPIPASDLQDGVNTVVVATDSPADYWLANVDLIFIGARPISGAPPTTTTSTSAVGTTIATSASSGPFSEPAFVQGVTSARDENSTAVTLAARVTSGNTLVVGVATDQKQAALADSFGDTFAPVEQSPDGNVTIYLSVAKAGGHDTIAIAIPGGGYVAITVAEFSGISGSEVGAPASSSGVSATPIGAHLTLAAGQLAVAFIEVKQSNQPQFPVPGWSDGPTHQLTAAGNHEVSLEFALGSGQNVTPGWTLAATAPWTLAQAVLR